MSEQYFSYDPATGQRGSTFPAPDAHVAGSYQDELYGAWAPNDSPLDPHEVPFDVGDDEDAGPVPENIIVDSPGPVPGPFSRSRQ
jgi:hypothetical protein